MGGGCYCHPGCFSGGRVTVGVGASLRAARASCCVSWLWCQWQSVRTMSTVVVSPGVRLPQCAASRFVVSLHLPPSLIWAVHWWPSRSKQSRRTLSGTCLTRLVQTTSESKFGYVLEHSPFGLCCHVLANECKVVVGVASRCGLVVKAP